jgi:hypothetical protein
VSEIDDGPEGGERVWLRVPEEAKLKTGLDLTGRLKVSRSQAGASDSDVQQKIQGKDPGRKTGSGRVKAVADQTPAEVKVGRDLRLLRAGPETPAPVWTSLAFLVAFGACATVVGCCATGWRCTAPVLSPPHHLHQPLPSPIAQRQKDDKGQGYAKLGLRMKEGRWAMAPSKQIHGVHPTCPAKPRLIGTATHHHPCRAETVDESHGFSRIGGPIGAVDLGTFDPGNQRASA